MIKEWNSLKMNMKETKNKHERISTVFGLGYSPIAPGTVSVP